MKAWMVSDTESCIFCRAETRSQAKKCWPEYNPFDSELFLSLRATREPRLDGPGPIDDIRPIYEGCDHCDYWSCDCWETGASIDWDRTLKEAAR